MHVGQLLRMFYNQKKRQSREMNVLEKLNKVLYKIMEYNKNRHSIDTPPPPLENHDHFDYHTCRTLLFCLLVPAFAFEEGERTIWPGVSIERLLFVQGCDYLKNVLIRDGTFITFTHILCAAQRTFTCSFFWTFRWVVISENFCHQFGLSTRSSFQLWCSVVVLQWWMSEIGSSK